VISKEIDMKVIGITGKAGSGKDTFAELLKTALDQRCRISGAIAIDQISAPLKDAVIAMLDIHPLEIEDREFKETSLLDDFGIDYSPRQMLQTLGTEWGRGIDEDIWLKLLTPRLESYAKYGAEYCLITDVRFPNEHTWIDNMGGVVVEIYRPLAPAVASHSSEDGLNRETDYFISNDSTINGLRHQAEELADELMQEAQVKKEYLEALSSRRLNDVTPSEWDAVAKKYLPF